MKTKDAYGGKVQWKTRIRFRWQGVCFRTVETLAQTGPGSLAELSQKLGLHKSTMHRVLSSLIYMDYVKQDQDTGKYSLTYKLLQVSNQAMDHVDI